MLRGVAADLGHPLGHPLLEQLPLDQFLGVGVDVHAAAQPFHVADELDQFPGVLDRPVDQPSRQADDFRIGLVGQLQVQGQLFAVEHVDEDLAVAVGLPPHRGREAPPHAVHEVKNVLAGA